MNISSKSDLVLAMSHYDDMSSHEKQQLVQTMYSKLLCTYAAVEKIEEYNRDSKSIVSEITKVIAEEIRKCLRVE